MVLDHPVHSLDRDRVGVRSRPANAAPAGVRERPALAYANWSMNPRALEANTMKILTFGTRLVNRLVPAVDAHATICPPYTVTCYCLNHRKYMRVCSACPAGGGGCSACLATVIAC
jgi:hypothetical protein